MRRQSSLRPAALVVLLTAALFSAPATGLSLTESPGFDISSLIGVPTDFPLDPGSNVVTGDVGGNLSGGATNGSDADFLTVVVPAGFTLAAIDVLAHSGQSTRSFIGFGIGATLSALDPSGIVDGALFGANTGNLLDGMNVGLGDGSLGDPLPSGTYAFWIQETGGLVNYSLDFVTVTASEPSLMGLALVASTALRLRRRR
ncbi:MAG: hypothetical protein QNK05_23875 [Myxococcota bacterium]|nr:hypothetical protein [Myxococcota bacterium]